MSKKSIQQKKKHEQNKHAAQDKKDIAAIKQELDINPLPDFELQVGDDITNEILNGDVQVRWCITEELIDVLNESGVKDPHILLISTKTGSRAEMSRQLLPVTQLKTFVRCTKAGQVNIHAWIIDGSEGRKELRRKYLRKVDGSYSTDLLDYNGTVYLHLNSGVAKYTVAEVVIPEGVFGKEPGPRMKAFVNLWHSSKVVDECNYRQRKIIAFTLKWEAMIIFTLLSLTFRLLWATILIACGFRRMVNWTYIPNVFYWNVADCFTDRYQSWWDNDYIVSMKMNDEQGMNFTRRFVTFVPLAPAVQVIMFTLICMFSSNWVFVDEFITLFKILIALTTISVIIDVCVTIFIWSFNTPLWNWLSKQFDKVYKILQLRDELGLRILNVIGTMAAVAIVALIIYLFWDKAQWILAFFGVLIAGMGVFYGMLIVFYKMFTIDEAHNNINDVRELLCNDCDTAVKMGEPRVLPFPSRQRRIKLLYLETKNKICKPMQQ